MRHTAPVEAVFPLLCPVLEYDWIPHWRCEMIHSECGVAETDCVFTTQFPDTGPQTWTCSRYEPPLRIDYVIMGPHHVTRLGIRLEELAQGSRSIWTRTYTGLDEQGNAVVDAVTEAHYAAQATLLERLLNHYLQTGSMLHPE